MKRLFAALLAIVFILPAFSVLAENSSDTALDIGTDLQSQAVKGTYFDYKEELNFLAADGETELIADGTVKLNSEEKASFEFAVDSDSRYIIEIEYNASQSKDKPEFALKIDGDFCFEEMATLELPQIWVDGGEIRADSVGNQSAPDQALWDGFTKQYISDSTGIALDPYEFDLTAGNHTLEIEVLSGSLEIKQITLTAPLEAPDYATYKKSYKAESYKGEQIVIEAENAVYKTDKTLIPKSDNSDPSLSPSSATKTLLNTIGFNSWNSPSEEISWKVNVPQSGYYKLGFKFKQSEAVNTTSYRKILIDGEVPFKEAEAVPFVYGNGWQYSEFFSKEEEPYLFYLKKGEHIITMSVTLSTTAEYYRRLEKVVNSLGDIYINISMITGESPDKNRDYDLFRQIPDLNENLQADYDSLVSLADEMNKSTQMSGSSMIAALKSMARVLKSMIDNPYTAQRYLSDYYSNYTGVGGWLYDMKSMPLSLDRIILSAPEKEAEAVEKGFFNKLFFGISRFIASFSADYNTLGTAGGDRPTIKIWVNWGRDQAEILGNMIAEDFTPEKNINVKLEIVNAGIIKGILAGNPPDLSLHMARSEPVNLAMRDALYDLTKFKDYESVSERFSKTASVPYEYNGGVYALPDTQAFYVMYYRSDILNKLNIKVPTTWQEFIEATVTLQRNNMQVWIPYLKITTATTVNTGVGGLSLFPTLMHQNGLSMYNDEGTACTLSKTETLEVFEFWTDFYTKYKLPKEASFYNRFRIGTMPLGIESYTLYQTLVNAAPEISENWSIAEIPGVEGENGKINNAIAGSGTGCGIISGTGNEKYAWEFLKWWTDADTQLKYSDSVETILGTLGRVASANIEAVSNMSWKKQDLNVILSAWENVEEVAEVPGSYYLTRAVDQAYWAVVNGNSSTKEALLTWSKVADNEITRKINDYSN